MSQKQPKEIYALCLILVGVSSYIWSVEKIGLELKLAFSSIFFVLCLVFSFVFIELDKVKNP
jgi:ABC-type iron transport system FetAB permease component